MKIERAIYRPSVEHATPRGVADFWTEVFAALDAKPRPVEVEIDFSEAAPVAPMTLDLEQGEPLFLQPGEPSAHGRLGGRWLAEHDVPWTLSAKTTRFRLVPAGDRRIRVRPGGRSFLLKAITWK